MIPVMRMATVAHMSPSRPQRRDQETIPVMLDGVAVLVGVERTSTKGPGDDPGHAMMLGHGSINTTAQPQRRDWGGWSQSCRAASHVPLDLETSTKGLGDDPSHPPSTRATTWSRANLNEGTEDDPSHTISS